MKSRVLRRLIFAAGAAVALLLGGCASTIRSDVTTFHQWPAALADKTYVFEAPPAQDDTLELRSYQNLVRGELGKLGFREPAASEQPALKVAMKFTTTDVPVRVLMPTYMPPMLVGPRYGFSSRYSMYRPYWGHRRYWGGGWYSPFYDPFWDPFPAYTETIQHYYRRELRVVIRSAGDGKQLFDVTVHNNSTEVSTPIIMPALVTSAFQGFPGVSGQARRVELKRTN